MIEEFLSGSTASSISTAGSALRADDGTLERGYTIDVDATAAAGLTCVHLDCIVHDGVPHVIELNPRIAGSFICDIVRDGYGFNVVEALLDKLDGRPVDIPALFEPHAYARAEFLLDSDPGAWRFAQAGEIHDGTVTISYGPQVLPDRERRAFLYVRVALPVAHGVDGAAAHPGSSAHGNAVAQPAVSGSP